MNRSRNDAKPPGQAVNWPLITSHFISLPLDLVLHNVKTFGVRAVRPRTGGALLIMFLFVAFHPDENVIPLIANMVAVVALSIIAYISAKLRLRRGQECNSWYTGRPHLCRLFPRRRETTIKRLEPFLALAAGAAIYHFNHPLGSFVIAAAIGIAVRVGVEYRDMQARALDVNDAIINQKITFDMAHRTKRR
jgi:hypothetical protein